MIEFNVTQITKHGYAFCIGEDQTSLDTFILDKDEIIGTAKNLIKAAMELLPDECKGEIELLNAVHSKLKSKELK